MPKSAKDIPAFQWYPLNLAAKFSGLSEAMVNYLCRSGLVIPTFRLKRGRGVTRRY